MVIFSSNSILIGAYKIYPTIDSADINHEKEPIIIRVGIIESNLLTLDCTTLKKGFEKELDEYSWTVGDQTYIINITEIKRKEGSIFYFSDLLNYRKIKNNYDVLLASGATDEQILNGFFLTKNKIKTKLLKMNLEKFVKEGGGFIGHCGGSTLPIKTAFNPPRTSSENIIHNGYFCNMNVSIYFHLGNPIICEHFYLERIFNPRLWLRYKTHPEYLGTNAYLWYTNFDMPSGVPMNINIRDNDHPIFRGYHNDTIFIHWGGGPAFILPIDNLNITNLADYPYEEFAYVNESTRIYYWSFNEKFPLLKYGFNSFLNLLHSSRLVKSIINKNNKLKNLFNRNITDWDLTNIPVISDHPNHSTLVTFNYPEGNKNGGRFLLCGCHPEFRVWDRKNNYISIAEDDEDNQPSDGLIKWVNNNGTPDDLSDDWILDKSHCINDPLCWFIRREVAWAYNKIPDDYYPPIYGRSEVVDIKPKLKNYPIFIINCSVGKEKDEKWLESNLSLYYRYKENKSCDERSKWTFYNSIYTSPWQFLFNSSQAYGKGIYEFFSILNTTQYNGTSYYYNCDSTPPAADTSCVVGASILADFSYKPGTAYVNNNVYFTSESIPNSGYHITNYQWQFGDGKTSNKTNPTHVFDSIGEYKVTLKVWNNNSDSDIITKNIKVINVPENSDL